MPRRIPDYPDAYAGWNSIASYGSLVTVAGLVLFFYIVSESFAAGVRVSSDPWLNKNPWCFSRINLNFKNTKCIK